MLKIDNASYLSLNIPEKDFFYLQSMFLTITESGKQNFVYFCESGSYMKVNKPIQNNYIMKSLFVSAVIAAMMISCSQQPGVTFALSGLEADDSIKVMCNSLSDDTEMSVSENLAIPNGVLFIPNTNDIPKIYNIYKLPRRFPDGSMEAMSMHGIYLPVLPGTAIKVEGDFKNYTITGNTTFYKELAALEAQIKPLRKEAFAAAIASYDKQRTAEQRDSLDAVANDYNSRISAIVNNYINDNSDSDVALYAFYFYGDISKDYEYLQKISERVRKGVFAQYYNKMVKQHTDIQKREEAQKLVADGMVAPDFTLRSIDGKDIALSSLRGKYIVLDFWGSWCGWCIKGIPEMKKMYNKYKKHLEIVGIACGDTEDVWKKCVAQNNLPWTNLLNGEGENNVPANYAIKGYPTKIILDKEGRILKTVLGESPEFYTFIDSLMTK